MNLLTYRIDLIWHLAWRDFTLRYKRSVLGILWSLVPPLSQLLVLVFLFRKVIPLNIESYPAFVFSGLLPWVWFSACLSSAANLFMNNRDLVRRPNFEPWTLVIISTLSNLANYLFFLPILLILLVLYDRSLTPFLLLFPMLAFIQVILIVGISLILATLSVFYRDVEYLISVALMLLFYLTPVFYHPKAFGESYRFLYQANPIAVLVGSYRAIFFYGSSPDWYPLLLTFLMSSAVLAFGWFVYNHKLSDVIDEI